MYTTMRIRFPKGRTVQQVLRCPWVPMIYKRIRDESGGVILDITVRDEMVEQYRHEAECSGAVVLTVRKTK